MIQWPYIGHAANQGDRAGTRAGSSPGAWGCFQQKYHQQLDRVRAGGHGKGGAITISQPDLRFHSYQQHAAVVSGSGLSLTSDSNRHMHGAFICHQSFQPTYRDYSVGSHRESTGTGGTFLKHRYILWCGKYSANYYMCGRLQDMPHGSQGWDKSAAAICCSMLTSILLS